MPYIRMRGEFKGINSDIPIPVTFDTDSGIFSFGLLEIDTRGKGLGLAMDSTYGIDTWETIKNMLEEKGLDGLAK